MCDPVSLTLGSAAIGAVGSLYGGLSANRAARDNAALLDRQSALRMEQARVEQESADIRARRAAGSRNAGIGTTGVTAESFSDVINDDLQSTALEQRLIQYGALTDSQNLRAKAGNMRKQGSEALIGSVFSAAGQIADGSGKAYERSNKGVKVGSTFGGDGGVHG